MHERTIKRGQALREARLYKGLTQKEVCDMVEGISQSNLSCYERGYPQISEEKVKKIFEHIKNS